MHTHIHTVVCALTVVWALKVETEKQLVRPASAGTIFH